MYLIRSVVLIALLLSVVACGSKSHIGTELASPGQGRQEQLDPVLTQPSPGHSGGIVLTAQEQQALNSESRIRYSNTPLARKLIAEQFVFLNRDIRFKVEAWINRGERYLPHARKVFAERGLPEDLIYLPFIESGYNPMAYSPSGAAGCWQFMPFTGRRFNLSVDWWMDERRDPYRAAHAAADYLTILHNMFGDWSLAIAAYNAGEGKIGRALKATGARDFFELVERNHTLDEKMALREETLHYVPRFAAMVKIANNTQLLGLKPINWNAAPDLREVVVPGGTDLRGLAHAASMEWSDFENHNPAFRRETTPPARKTVIYVPTQSVAAVQRFAASPSARSHEGYRAYTVRNGDSWSIIAQRHGVSADALKQINNQSSNTLQVGQRVMVPISDSARRDYAAADAPAPRNPSRNLQQQSGAATAMQSRPRPAAQTQGAVSTYQVRSGDTLYSLAKRFGCSVETLLRINGMQSPRDLHAGRTLRVPGGNSAPVTTDYQPAAQQTATRASVAPTQPAVQQTAAQGRATIYKVRPGDTVWSIARNHNVSPLKILEWNNLSRNSVIQPGDRISLYE